MMIKPFQIIAELIEFGLQALFVYVLVILLFIGFMAYTFESISNSPDKVIYIKAPTQTTPKKVCMKVAGCRIFKDGTVEYE
tara:strand:- start:601 stop:843 length:243 start_codon:yes stop_codon:yes gene_type:complete